MVYKRLLLLIISIFLILIGSYFFYIKFFQKNEWVEIITSDDEVFKKRPEDPGGIVIPHSSSLIYEKLNKSHLRRENINLLPEPEKPMDIGFFEPPDVQYFDSIDKILANIEFYEDQLQNKIIEQDNNDTPNLAMPNIISNKNDNKVEKQLAEDFYDTALNVTKVSNGNKLRKITDTNNDILGYKIQLSQARSEPEAIKEWKKIEAKNSKILQGSSLITKKVEGKNKRIFYLVIAGTYPSLNHAKLVCKKLQLQKQNCIVTK